MRRLGGIGGWGRVGGGVRCRSCHIGYTVVWLPCYEVCFDATNVPCVCERGHIKHEEHTLTAVSYCTTPCVNCQQVMVSIKTLTVRGSCTNSSSVWQLSDSYPWNGPVLYPQFHMNTVYPGVAFCFNIAEVVGRSVEGHEF